ncbi:hypothetical protein DHEL01_v205061 [Diaporthe helianthi]|uniref:Heterokaryon incompatibility domain-containing protein n=1 Tax=Diaporthe helianthi TaxID=158607 RepID=A0A2P5I1Y8_DIAHE|nr:hypothetical protein DHEL01_v205061 [Diaporthe helianthi]
MATQGLSSSTRQLSYKNLSRDRNEIRLLEIQPASDLNDIIVARLVNRQLTPELEFIGVSALYGDTDVSEKVQIDNKHIAIPANLSQALRHVRAVFSQSDISSNASEGEGASIEVKKSRELKLEKRPPRWLGNILRSLGFERPEVDRAKNQNSVLLVWLEAVCINRRDAREQKEQNRTMSVAYRHAKAVVGWLGPKDDTSDQAVSIMRTCDRALPHHFGTPEDRELHPENYAPEYVWMDQIKHIWAMPDGMTDLRQLSNFRALAKFLQRPYFQRDWILSELAMGTFPTFLVGEEIVSWSEVLRWNRCNEELIDVATVHFPEEFRSVIETFMPLGTVYTMLKEFERRRDSPGFGSDARSMLTRGSSKSGA